MIHDCSSMQKPKKADKTDKTVKRKALSFKKNLHLKLEHVVISHS